MKTEILCSSTGLRQIRAAHTAATLAHEPVLLSGLVAIPMVNEDADVENVFSIEAEALAVDKAAGQAWAGGAKIYWNNTAKNFTTTASGNTLCGRVIKPAASDDTRGHIQLNPNVNA
jgi:predicted RecA/RadA family phage recombinase